MNTVQSVTDLVKVQPGAVVSRTLINKSAGTVTLFAFDAGEGLSEHTAPFDAPLLVIEGDADITIGGAIHRVGAGQIVVLPAGVPHAVRAISPMTMMLVMIRASRAAE